MARGGRWGTGDGEAVAAGDEPLDRLAGFRVGGEGVVFHALLDFEALWLLVGGLGDGLVNVGCHENQG